MTKFLNRKTESEVRVLHSNKSQNARINAIKDFESGVVNHRPSSSLPDGLPGTPKMKFEIEGGIAPPPLGFKNK